MKASTKMQKGFTLIELMVVIVIIGILSAVALPKMFGLSAKAKVSEVAPSAATYERLQQAYIAEVSDVGPFASIGFEAPTGSKFFSYAEDVTAGTDAELEISLKNDISSDCLKTATQATNLWTTTVTTASAITRVNAPATGAATKCGALTPSF